MSRYASRRRWAATAPHAPVKTATRSPDREEKT